MCVFGSALDKLFSRAIFDWIASLLIAPKWGISLPVDDERVIWQRVRINLSRFWGCSGTWATYVRGDYHRIMMRMMYAMRRLCQALSLCLS